MVFGLILAIYILSYVALSTFGAYASASCGLGQQGLQPKNYKWLPLGFYTPTTGEWRHAPVIIYAPLFIADNRYWHTHGRFPEDGDPRHPVVITGLNRK